MYNDTRQILQNYLEYLKGILGLSHWTIELSDERPEDPNALGEIWPTEGRCVATLRLHPDFKSYEPEKLASILVHELIHCHFQSACDVVRVDICEAQLLPRATYEVVWTMFKRQVEYGVDGLSTAVASLVKPIVW